MSPTTTGTVARAMEVLCAIAETDGPVTIAGLARELELPRPTIHRLLGLLGEQGFVESVDRRYVVGREFFRVAALVNSRHDLVRAATPHMEGVVEDCGETCLLGVYLPARRKMVCAAEAASPHPLGYRIDLNVPMSVVWGASGRAILAFLPPAEVEEVLRQEGGPSPTTGERLPGRLVLAEELETIRTRGYAYSEGQKIPGSRGIAAPVMSASGYAVGSLFLTIPEFRYRAHMHDEIARSVVAHAASLSRSLGYRPQAVAEDRQEA